MVVCECCVTVCLAVGVAVFPKPEHNNSIIAVPCKVFLHVVAVVHVPPASALVVVGRHRVVYLLVVVGEQSSSSSCGLTKITRTRTTRSPRWTCKRRCCCGC